MEKKNEQNWQESNTLTNACQTPLVSASHSPLTVALKRKQNHIFYRHSFSLYKTSLREKTTLYIITSNIHRLPKPASGVQTTLVKANLTFLTTARTTVTQFSSGKSPYVCLPLVLTSVGSGLIGQDLSVRYLELISLVSNFMLISSETFNFLPACVKTALL